MVLIVNKAVNENQRKIKLVKLIKLLLTLLVVICANSFPLRALAAPNVAEIANNVASNIKSMHILQVDLNIEMFDAKGKAQNMSGRVTVDQKKKITRLEILEHSIFKGQIIVVDILNDEAIVYMPVTSAAVIGKIKTVGSQLGQVDLTSLNMDELLSLDPADILNMKYIKTEEYDRHSHYVIEVKTNISGSGTQIVWVDAETNLVKKVEVFDDLGRNIANVVTENFKWNFSYDFKQLKELPKDAKLTSLR